MARLQSHQAALRPPSESLLARRGHQRAGVEGGPGFPLKTDVEAGGTLRSVLGRASCHLAPQPRQPGSDSRPVLALDICPDKVKRAATPQGLPQTSSGSRMNLRDGEREHADNLHAEAQTVLRSSAGAQRTCVSDVRHGYMPAFHVSILQRELFHPWDLASALTVTLWSCPACVSWCGLSREALWSPRAEGTVSSQEGWQRARGAPAAPSEACSPLPARGRRSGIPESDVTITATKSNLSHSFESALHGCSSG